MNLDNEDNQVNLESNEENIDTNEVIEETEEVGSNEIESNEDESGMPDDESKEEETQEVEDVETTETSEEPLLLVKFKTEEELQAHIEAQINVKMDSIKEIDEQKQKEATHQQALVESDKYLSEIDQAITQLPDLLEKGMITIEQYNEALVNAGTLKAEHKVNKAKLEAHTLEVLKPKVFKENETLYNTMLTTNEDLKNPVINKYARKFKKEVFDDHAIKLDSVYDNYLGFIVDCVKDAEAQGYSKALKQNGLANTKTKMNGSIATTSSAKQSKIKKGDINLSEYGF